MFRFDIAICHRFVPQWLRSHPWLYFKCLALLEIAIGIGFGIYAFLFLPSTNAVTTTSVTASAALDTLVKQTELLKGKLEYDERGSIRKTVNSLTQQSKLVADQLGRGNVDFEMLIVVRDSMATSERLLDGLSQSMAPTSLREFGVGLNELAQFLETKTIPGVHEAASRIESTADIVREQGHIVTKFFEQTTIDLNALRQVQGSIASYAKLAGTLDQNLDSLTLKIRDAASGMASSAALIDRAANVSHWVSRATEEQLRSTAKGVRAMKEAAENFDRNLLPFVRESLRSSQMLLDATARQMASVIERQEAIEDLAQKFPILVAKASDEIPRICKELASILRETAAIAAVASALRTAKLHLDRIAANWPEIEMDISQSTKLLGGMQQYLDRLIANRSTIEKAQSQLRVLSEEFYDSMPLAFEEFCDREVGIMEDVITISKQSKMAVNSTVELTLWFLPVARLTLFSGALLMLLRGVHALITID